jgi:hypothetical protein
LYSMISSLKKRLLLDLKNIPGKRIKRKIVVIECDDWGSIRMPSKQVYNKLCEAGIIVNNNHFTRFDTLADKDDLESLFEVLCNVKDLNGQSAVMTPFCNVANPDFEKIRQSGFNEYHYEPFTETLQRYNRHPETFQLWQEGIKAGIFVPESHGREHLAVQFWMQKLLEGDKKLHIAFDYEYTSVDIVGIPAVAQQFRPEFYYNSDDQKKFLEHSIKDGIALFEQLFGYKPTAFVPGNGVFHPDLENALSETSVKFLHTGYWEPIYNTDGSISHSLHSFGQKSKSGLRYYMRNCSFEPTSEIYHGIELTIKQIEAAFRWHKPAIIGSHRVNFIGGIDKANREKGLKELRILLTKIIENWPDVEFMSTSELLTTMKPKIIQ